MLLISKEFYCICVIQDNGLITTSPKKNILNIEEKKDTIFEEKITHIYENLDKKFSLIEVFTLETNCEITSVQIDLTKALILINSTDKYLR